MPGGQVQMNKVGLLIGVLGVVSPTLAHVPTQIAPALPVVGPQKAAPTSPLPTLSPTPGLTGRAMMWPQGTVLPTIKALQT
jgi:hypothetical protein